MRQAAVDFAAEIKLRSKFALLCAPEAPIVCFQYMAQGLSFEENNRLNQQIRETIFAQGRLLLNYAHIDQKTVLRCVISSPEFGSEHALEILDTVEKTAQTLLVVFHKMTQVAGKLQFDLRHIGERRDIVTNALTYQL